MVSDRSGSINVNPAPSAPGMACTAKVATWVSRSSRLNRAADNPANAVRLLRQVLVVRASSTIPVRAGRRSAGGGVIGLVG